MSAAVIDVRDVAVRRTVEGVPVTILAGIDWTVHAGEHWVVLGPNGAGKTTLLHLAGALMHPTSGTAEVLGHRLGRVDVRALREDVGIVDARTARALPGRRDVRTTVLSGAFNSIALQHRRMTPAHEAAADALLEATGSSALASRTFEDCSQGERQRVLLARALMTEPRLLLLDEPYSGLDMPSRERLVGALTRLARDRPHLPTVTVTHHLEEIAPSTTHALLLRDGGVLAGGPIAEVLTDAQVSDCFALPIAVHRRDGRWSATLGR